MNPFLRKALIGLGLVGAGGAGGYYMGQKGGEEEAKEIFDEYNKEENEALANEAFVSGVEYAMGKQSNLKGAVMKQEEFDKIASEAFDDEMQKIAINMSGVKESDKKIISNIQGAGKKVGSFYSGALKDAKTLPENARNRLRSVAGEPSTRNATQAALQAGPMSRRAHSPARTISPRPIEAPQAYSRTRHCRPRSSPQASSHRQCPEENVAPCR